MISEIKFRAKKSDGRDKEKWVYGYFEENRYDSFIRTPLPDRKIVNNTEISFITYFVDPKTVGQYVGLSDKNKTKIYTGDIIQLCPYTSEQRKKFGLGVGRADNRVVVEYFKDHAAFGIQLLDDCIWFFKTHFHSSDVLTIGNVHDNPELLEKSKENE